MGLCPLFLKFWVMSAFKAPSVTLFGGAGEGALQSMCLTSWPILEIFCSFFER